MDFETIKSNEKVRIVIIGVGGGGGNAVNRMVEDGIHGVEYITANTDNQALMSTLADNKIQLGEKLTGGIGAGARPEIGKKAAEESYDKIKEELAGADMVFITAGMGGGTGTGAAPIIAQIGREINALTVGIVTTPFKFEGAKKRDMAEQGLEELKKNLDSIIIIPNDKIFEISPKGTTLIEAFKKGNEILKKGAKGIVDIIKEEGLLNIDFADVKTVMKNSGECHVCHMGFGKAKGENRALEAAKLAITSPLLETSINHATNILVNITTTMETAMMEDLDTIGSFISEAVGENEHFNADNIIMGYTFAPDMGEELSVVVIATGIEDDVDGKKVARTSESVSEKIEKRFANAGDELLETESDNEIQDIEKITEVKTTQELNIPSFLRNSKRK